MRKSIRKKIKMDRREREMCRTERRMSPGKIEKEGKYSVEIAYFFDIMLWKAVIYREENLHDKAVERVMHQNRTGKQSVGMSEQVYEDSDQKYTRSLRSKSGVMKAEHNVLS